MQSDPQSQGISDMTAIPKDENLLPSCQLEGSLQASDSGDGTAVTFSPPHPVHLTKNHTQTLSSLQHGSVPMEPGYSDSAESRTLPTTSASSQDIHPTDSMHHTSQSGDGAYYKLDEIDEDTSNSGDVMSDLLEQNTEAMPGSSHAEAHNMMIQNVHSQSGRLQPSQQVGARFHNNSVQVL